VAPTQGDELWPDEQEEERLGKEIDD